MIWAGLFALWAGLDMATWIALFLAAFTLPALWDIIRDPRNTIEVWPNRIVWSSTLGQGDRTDVDHVRLNRRFDGTFKATLVHVGGATTRLPPDIAPPVDAFEAALKDAGIASQRHPFSPI
ncbi:hypothetical protein L0664_04115 [Octadecabacter sp. G9-8]|uniref:PH domain-containing protein n=1 Tax=Octadecabacter dasysiphoniae TaxID=2909341 RepID=A0ABS9CW40_9RHOB|nr:hypothetical protein [Octadecabacter dasysiphoniae]MCF2870243.1 hypothetical protein [Octadecabacter dasysiphoniae]